MTWIMFAFWGTFTFLDIRLFDLAKHRIKLKAQAVEFGGYYRTLTQLDSDWYYLPGAGIYAYVRYGR
jgi:hypothetical protein